MDGGSAVFHTAEAGYCEPDCETANACKEVIAQKRLFEAFNLHVVRTSVISFTEVRDVLAVTVADNLTFTPTVLGYNGLKIVGFPCLSCSRCRCD